MIQSHLPIKIADGHVLHRTTPIEQPVKTAFGTMVKRHALFLLLRDGSGQIGVGESWINFPVWGHHTRRAAFESTIIPWLIGREITHVPTTIQELYSLLEGPARQSGTIGPMLSAICAVELALWDLVGRRMNRPVSHLLFDNPASSVQVYASGINSPLPTKLIHQHLDAGVTLFKLKLGFGNEEDRLNLKTLKNILGSQASLAVDVNRGWCIEEAQQWLPILADYDIQWLEEPLRFADEHHLAELRETSAVPLSGGENIQMAPGSDPISYADAPFDILQPDITKYTPLHIARAMLPAVESRNKRLIPHILGSGPGQAASLQLAAGTSVPLVELDINTNPLRTDICNEPFEIIDGKIKISSRAGIGRSLKEIDE